MIRKADRTTYITVGIPLLDDLEKVFQEQGHEYEILYGDDIPADVPRYVDLEGRQMTLSVCCVKSYMNADDVREAMLRIWRPSKYGRIEDMT